MPAKHLVVDEKAKKQLSRTPLYVHTKIIKNLDSLKSNPIAGERLKGKLKGFYKFRVGDYRIVYRFDMKSKTIFVVKIEHRQGVYR